MAVHRYLMCNFHEFVQNRDDLRSEDQNGEWIPFVQKPSSKIPSCKDLTRRLVRKFRPRIVKTAPVAIQRPRVQPFTWGPIR